MKFINPTSKGMTVMKISTLAAAV
ncbi:MAG: hypothetical protein RLZZ627_2127, partial [Pseudomonadota bacterium]